MRPGDCFWQPFVVPHQPAGARDPGKTALCHPAPGQRHEPALGVGRLNDLQPDAVGRGPWGGLVPGLALVHKGDLHGLAGRLLHRGGQEGDRVPLSLVRRSDAQRQQRAEGVLRRVRLPALAVGCTVRPSRSIAEGASARPAAQHPSARKSCTVRSKPPAAIQRCVCWETAAHGGAVVGNRRHCTPVRTIPGSALTTSRRSWRDWGLQHLSTSETGRRPPTPHRSLRPGTACGHPSFPSHRPTKPITGSNPR